METRVYNLYDDINFGMSNKFYDTYDTVEFWNWLLFGPYLSGIADLVFTKAIAYW